LQGGWWTPENTTELNSKSIAAIKSEVEKKKKKEKKRGKKERKKKKKKKKVFVNYRKRLKPG